jgi:RNA polymerase sigma-70 factor (ECF subfamily)
VDLSDDDVLAGLRRGDEQVFRDLVTSLSPLLLRLARSYTRSPATAQDAVQDTWLAVVEGLPSFEGRSSLKTWVCGILVNKARRTGVKESRVLPLNLLGRDPAVDASRFAGRRDAQPTGTWLVPPVRWDQQPEERLSSRELRVVIDEAIAALPLRQRELITVRDVLGMDSDEAAALLGLSTGNQRVLLHRARSKVRTAVEDYARTQLDDQPAPADERSTP